MYQHATKLLLAGVVAVALLAIGGTSVLSPAWARDKEVAQTLADLSPCGSGQVPKNAGIKGWVCADDNDTLADVPGCAVGDTIVLNKRSGAWECVPLPMDTDTLGDVPKCTTGDIVVFDNRSGAWECFSLEDVADTLRDIPGCEVSDSIVLGPGREWVCVPPQLDADTLRDIPGCIEGDVIEFDGSEWACVPPSGGAQAGMKTVFVTSATYLPDLATAGGGLNGLSGADNICNAHAVEGIVPSGHYIAWLSTSQKDAKDRLPPNDQGYVLSDGATVIAFSKDDLLDQVLENAIDQDEQGVTFIDHPLVWTGSRDIGEAFPVGDAPHHCEDWTFAGNDPGRQAVVGQVGSFPGGWSIVDGQHCDSPFHLYCFER